MMDLKEINEKYIKLTPLQRIEQLFKDYEKVLITSSFGTTSAYLLHLINQVKPGYEVHFIDTTYHFKETLEYKEKLTSLLKLNLKVLKGEKWKNDYTRNFEIWESDPDICCSINKVEPIEKVKPEYDVWVSGLMHWQSRHRNGLKVFHEQADMLKFYPIIDVDEEDVMNFYRDHKLPVHPLFGQGYESVGCIHCTKQGRRREGRWVNFFKNECGLHI